MKSDSDLVARGRKYAELSGTKLDLKAPLGSGTDGAVWVTGRKSAVKALYRERNYQHELACYQRFCESGATKILDFQIPELLGHNDDLMVIEIGIVGPPYILDFAKVSLDAPPDFDDFVMQEEEARHLEYFGAERWEVVKEVMWILESQFGIHYLDPKPGNIMFANDD
jgi:hypothetical protein